MAQGVVISAPDGEPVMTENYDADTITVADNTNDQDLRAASNNLFNDVYVTHSIAIHSKGTVKVRFNGTGEDQITVTPNKRFDEERLLVRNIYISNNSGVSVDVEFYLRGPAQ